jgi:alpha-1,6-mannosyltransferase
VLAAPILLQVVLLFQRPWLSTDVLSYAAQGYLGIDGAGLANPYLSAPRDVLGTPFGAQLTALGWRPQAILSPYGPLWTAVEVGVLSVTRDLAVATVLLKLPAFLASVGSAALIWTILGWVRPRLRLVGTVAFLWSPVVLTELSGEGHVDGLMTFLVLAGIAATLRGRPVSSAVAGSLAVLTKYVPMIFVPAQLIYLLRARHPATSRTWLVAAAALAAALAVCAFAPFWAGLRTLEGLRIMGQPGPWPTLTGLVYRAVERTLPWLDPGVIATLLVSAGFFIAALRIAAGVRDDRSLLRALALTALLFVLVASPVFYPWYAVLPIALVALVPERPLLIVIVALTATSRLVAPLVDLRPAFDPVPTAAYTATIAGLSICIALATALWLRSVWTWAAGGDDGASAEESPVGVA